MEKLTKKWFSIKRLFVPILILILVNLYFIYLTSRYFLIDSNMQLFIIVIINQIYIVFGIFIYLGLVAYDRFRDELREQSYYVAQLRDKIAKQELKNEKK